MKYSLKASRAEAQEQAINIGGKIAFSKLGWKI